jgi:catechol 2,3-dioxygenase-like lactoylglutathione lyase family enzyme
MSDRASSALDSVTVTATDIAALLPFYDAALGALGLVRVAELVDEEEEDSELEAIAWGSAGDERALLWLVAGPWPTSGLHVRLRAVSRDQVESFFARSVAAGGEAHDAPRRWVIYRRGEFNAVVRDPAGNLVEAVAPE